MFTSLRRCMADKGNTCMNPICNTLYICDIHNIYYIYIHTIRNYYCDVCHILFICRPPLLQTSRSPFFPPSLPSCIPPLVVDSIVKAGVSYNKMSTANYMILPRNLTLTCKYYTQTLGTNAWIYIKITVELKYLTINTGYVTQM